VELCLVEYVPRTVSLVTDVPNEGVTMSVSTARIGHSSRLRTALSRALLFVSNLGQAL
jgi:hypothetical protein